MTEKRLHLLVITSIFNSKRRGKALVPSQLRARLGVTAAQLAGALNDLRAAGLLDGQSRLTFTGLAVAASLRQRSQQRPSHAVVSRLASQTRTGWSSGRLAA